MASTPASTRESQSSFKKTICLFDWWLIKTKSEFQQNKRLGVAGITSRQKQAVRVFSSAAIAKRYDVFTIETADDVCIVLKGLINSQRTLRNGFPSEVLKAFLLGFPTDWKQYADKYCGEDSIPDETPKQKQHVSYEDGKKIEVRKGQLHEVSENVVADPSNASNLNRNAADETKGTDVASVVVTRYSVRLKNLDGGQKKLPSRSLNNEKSVSPMSLLEETPKKKKHVSDEDTEEIEVPKHVLHEASENIASDPSIVSDLNRNAAEETKGTNVASIDFTICGLKNLKGGQKKSISNCSFNNGKNVSPMSGLVIGTIDDEKPNSSLDVTTRSGRKAEVSGDGSVPFLSSDEFQERLGANVAEKQDDDPASNSKQVHNSQNAKTKELDIAVVREVDAKEESTIGKKAKKKISLAVPETDAKEESTIGKKTKKRINFAVPEIDAKEESKPGKKIKRKIIREEQGIQGIQEEKVEKHIVSPECLSVGRSRSGRLLLPVLEFWRNQMPVYDKNRKVTGIQEERPVQVPVKGSRSKSQKKHKE